MEEDTLILELWVYPIRTTEAGGSPHTFYFSIAKPDDSNDPDPENVTSIDVTVPPDRTEYIEGQRFDRAGMAVTAWLNDGTSADVKGYTVTPQGVGGDEGLSTADTYVTISFGGKEVLLPITVLPGTSISDVRILNGQMYFEWKRIYVDAGVYEKKIQEYDAVVLYGEETGKFSFHASEEAEVTSDNGTVTKSGDIRLAELPPDGTTTITVAAGGTSLSYTFTCYQQAHSGMPSEVVGYICPASQYTNGAYQGDYGLNPWASLIGQDLEATVGSMFYGPVSLGNFGGYIVYRYDEPIRDNPNNPYGVDFIVYGNSVDPRQGFAEPGNVLVSEDGETWYALAGSAHYEDYAKWGASITYKKNSAGKSEIWADGKNTGTGDRYPIKGYYPLFPWTSELEKEMTFTGVALDMGGATDEHGSAAAAFPDFGYADTGERSESNAAGNPYVGVYYGGSHLDWETLRKNADGFDLKWAVNDDGEPVDLSDKDIYYIKIQCASNVGSGGGGIGEKSTEVNGVRVAEPAGGSVFVTAAPSVTVAGEPVALADGGMKDVAASGIFTVNVTPAAPTENIYINGVRGASRTFTETPGHGMIRVIVQEGDKAPFISYMNLTDGNAGAQKSTMVKLDADGGRFIVDNSLVESADLPFTTDVLPGSRTFPEPTKEGAAFLGWYDAGGTKYTAYSDTMPETLALKAKWQYDTKTVRLDADGGWFTLAGQLRQTAEMNFTVEAAPKDRAFPTPTKEGRKFLGWYDAGGTKCEGFEDGMPGWLELKARWEMSAAVSQDEAVSKDETPGQDNDYNSVDNATDPEAPAVVVEIGAGNDSFNPSTGVETVTVTPGSITDAIGQAVTVAALAGSDPVIAIKASAAAGSAVKEVRVDIPVADLETVANNNATSELNVKIESAAGEVTLNKAAVKDLVAEARDAETVEAVIEHKGKDDQDLTAGQKAAVSDGKVREVYDVSLYADGLDKLDGFRTSGWLTVGLPYTLLPGERGTGVLVRYVSGDGYTEPMTDGRRYDGGKGQAVFMTKHLSVYAVTYDPAYAAGGAEDTETGGSPDSGGGYDEGYDGDDLGLGAGCGTGAYGTALLLALALGLALRRKSA